VAGLGLGGIDADGPAARAVGSMGDWNQMRDRAISVHADTEGQCTDTTEAGIGTDGTACIVHMNTRSGGLGRAKSGTGMLT